MTARPPAKPEGDAEYDAMFGGVSRIVEAARQTAARAVNALMTAAYRAIGRYIVEFEQEGRERADYGGRLVERLFADLSARYGRGFSLRNLWQMRAFYRACRGGEANRYRAARSAADTAPRRQTLDAGAKRPGAPRRESVPCAGTCICRRGTRLFIGAWPTTRMRRRARSGGSLDK